MRREITYKLRPKYDHCVCGHRGLEHTLSLMANGTCAITSSSACEICECSFFERETDSHNVSDEEKELATEIHVMLEKMTIQKKCWITKKLCRIFDAHGEQLAAAIMEEKKAWDAIQEAKQRDAKNLGTPQCS